MKKALLILPLLLVFSCGKDSNIDYSQRCQEWTDALVALNQIIKDEDGYVNEEIQASIDKYLKLLRDFGCPALPIIISVEKQSAARKLQK